MMLGVYIRKSDTNQGEKAWIQKKETNSVVQMKSGEQKQICIKYTDQKKRKQLQRRLNEKCKMLEINSYISINSQSKYTNPPMKIKNCQIG